MAPDKIDNNTGVPLGWLIGVVAGMLVLCGGTITVVGVYYADKSSAKEQINDVVKVAVAATEQRRKEDQKVILDKLTELATADREFRLELEAVRSRTTVVEARLQSSNNERYSPYDADRIWREAERLNTWDNLQKYGLRKPDIWQLTLPSSPFATGSTIRNASPD